MAGWHLSSGEPKTFSASSDLSGTQIELIVMVAIRFISWSRSAILSPTFHAWAWLPEGAR